MVGILGYWEVGYESIVSREMLELDPISIRRLRKEFRNLISGNTSEG